MRMSFMRSVLGACVCLTAMAAEWADSASPAAIPEPSVMLSGPTTQPSNSGYIQGEVGTGEPSPTGCCQEPRFPRLKTGWQYFWGCDHGPTATPLGATVQAPISTQIANGDALRMVLYAYDFENDPCRDMSRLNPHGLRRLGELLCMLQHNACPIVIEQSRDNPSLDSLRQQRVLTLAQQTVPGLPSSRVVGGVPKATALSGEEAAEIYLNMLQQTKRSGGSGGTAGAGIMGGGAAAAQLQSQPTTRQ